MALRWLFHKPVPHKKIQCLRYTTAGTQQLERSAEDFLQNLPSEEVVGIPRHSQRIRVYSPMRANLRGSNEQAEAVAELALWLAEDHATHVTGTLIPIDSTND